MLTILRARLTVLLTAASLAVIGGTVGGMLGLLAPGYYRQVFHLREDVTPVELGIGLGVTQGSIWGLIIGLLIVAIIAWKGNAPCARAPISSCSTATAGGSNGPTGRHEFSRLLL